MGAHMLSFRKKYDPDICHFLIVLHDQCNLDFEYSKTYKSNRKAMNRNWSNQKSNPALKTKAGNK